MIHTINLLDKERHKMPTEDKRKIVRFFSFSLPERNAEMHILREE